MGDQPTRRAAGHSLSRSTEPTVPPRPGPGPHGAAARRPRFDRDGGSGPALAQPLKQRRFPTHVGRGVHGRAADVARRRLNDVGKDLTAIRRTVASAPGADPGRHRTPDRCTRATRRLVRLLLGPTGRRRTPGTHRDCGGPPQDGRFLAETGKKDAGSVARTRNPIGRVFQRGWSRKQNRRSMSPSCGAYIEAHGGRAA
ncbi:MAG: hypothetical protein QOD04_3553 [Pseudonocardiales bacterium]|nr:hypothetical protein [Pseudonocardiales bacterium]